MKMTLTELSSRIPEIDWSKYLSIVLAREVKSDESVVIFALKYFQELVKLIGSSEPRIVCNYLMWRFIRHRVNNLDRKFQVN